MASAFTQGKILTTAIADIGHQEGSAWQRPWQPTQKDLFKKIKSSRSSKHEEDTVNSSEKLKSVVYHTPGDSVRQRAMEIIRENRIQLVPSLKHWSVVGSCGDIYVVTLFKAGVRNMTCTCVASALCSQILAAMYSID
ncbi:hypothetical protein OUZ56_018399 [Daphnia magna]|uniref:SWIM-type domain-containing protein n=1 Tax=Daphnia magna TaxID=35525 RepID=A0ABQ9Z8Q7_9CRUS|nr:hypothetical protein OUZ56_018399 [Daphnia magna]